VAVVCGLLASPAAAFHIPGGDYSGYASGGTITFHVSKDGSSVTNLTLSGVHANDCTASDHSYSSIPINHNSFNNGEVSGDFPDVRGAYGRFNLPGSGSSSSLPALPTSCRVTGTWSAITGADPSGSDECKAARRKTHKLKHAIRRAEKTGNQRKLRKLQGKWRKARAKKDQFCG
jgi:hypothetical protein